MAVVVALMAQPQEFESGGLRYEVVSPGEVAVVSNWVDGYNAYEGVVVVPETVHYDGVTCRVTAIADDAFASSAVTCLQLPSSVTSIGVGAMADAALLTDVTLPLHLTIVPPFMLAGTAVTDVALPQGVTTIGRGAFQDCTQLHTLLLPASLQTIDEQAFEGCYNFYELYCAAPLPPAVVSASAFDDLRAVDVLVPNDAVAHAFADHPLWGQGKLFDLWTIEEPWEVTSPTVELTDGEAYNCIGLGGNHLAYEIYNDWGDVEAVTAASTYYVPTPKRAIDYTVRPTTMTMAPIESFALTIHAAPAVVEEMEIFDRGQVPQVVVHDGAIHIMGDNHDKWVQIYDVYGMLYYQRPGVDNVIDGLPSNRVYIVLVGDHASKVCL